MIEEPRTSSPQTGGGAPAEKGKGTPRLVPKDKEEARIHKLVLALGEKVLPRRQLIADVGLTQKSRCIFTYNYMKPAFERGLINFSYTTVPNKPEQTYRLTCKGLELYAQLTGRTDIFY